VISELAAHGEALGTPPPDASPDDPREAVRVAEVYYSNQRSQQSARQRIPTLRINLRKVELLQRHTLRLCCSTTTRMLFQDIQTRSHRFTAKNQQVSRRRKSAMWRCD